MSANSVPRALHFRFWDPLTRRSAHGGNEAERCERAGDRAGGGEAVANGAADLEWFDRFMARKGGEPPSPDDALPAPAQLP